MNRSDFIDTFDDIYSTQFRHDVHGPTESGDGWWVRLEQFVCCRDLPWDRFERIVVTWEGGEFEIVALDWQMNGYSRTGEADSPRSLCGTLENLLRKQPLEAAGLDYDTVVECPECDGEGGGIALGGYRQTGMGYGDCYQKEKWADCDLCEGRGDLRLRRLLEAEYDVEDLVEWYGETTEVAA